VKPLVVFPDPILATLELLRERVSPHYPNVSFVSRDYDESDPDNPGRPYLVVRQDGAYGQHPVTRTAALRLVAHETSEAKAYRLASVCQAVLLAYEGGVKVRSYGDLTGPIPSKDVDSGEPLAFFTVAARLRPSTL
jgi:hypothetical protein